MTSSIISSVAKELGARISYEVGLIWSAKEDLQNLKSELEAIQVVAEVADGLPYFTNIGVENWLQKLKNVAYDAEDVVDEYQAKSTKDDHKRMLVRGKQVCADPFTLLISCLRKHLVRRYRLGRKIKAINDRLTQISKERKHYKLEEMEATSAANRRAVISNRATTSFMVEENIVGRVSDRDVLVEKLLRTDSSSVPIVSIVGIGGLGKTTLAKMIFNDNRVRWHFKECRWWICVSQCLDAEDLTKRMLQEVMGSNVDLSALNTLCNNLNKVLSREKFLLVFDDVWDFKWWKQLEALLRMGADGSRILITTRMETISDEISAVYTHKPEIFSFSESWQLFLRKALKEGETEGDLETWNLKDVGEDIVRKCGGLPIAVETVGSAMRLKRREKEDWKYIAESGIWKMSSSSNNLLPWLVLSYDVLPSVLKRCFAYLSLCPKGYSLAKWNRWPLDMEGRSMPLLSTLEISECPDLESIPHFPELRRLEIRECNNLRSLHNDQGGLEPGTSATLTKLKVLKVEKCHGLKQLPCLRALEELEMRSLNNWEGWSTNSSMSQMRWLQMFGCPKLKSLPHLPALSYMSIEMCEELCTLWDEDNHPRELGTLVVFGCPRASFPVGSLPHLSKLQNLGMGGFLEWPYRSAPLPNGALPGLRVLGMSGIPGQAPLPYWLWHLSHLEALHLSGITEGTRLQGSWQNLKKLERMTIQNCPELTTLEDLISPHDVGSSSQQSQLTMLPKLQQLSICDCPQLKSLPEGLQQLVQLKSLTIEGLPELTSLPQKVTNLHKLEELIRKDCPKISSIPPGLSDRLKTGLAISGCTNLRVKKNSYRAIKRFWN